MSKLSRYEAEAKAAAKKAKAARSSTVKGDWHHNAEYWNELAREERAKNRAAKKTQR